MPTRNRLHVEEQLPGAAEERVMRPGGDQLPVLVQLLPRNLRVPGLPARDVLFGHAGVLQSGARDPGISYAVRTVLFLHQVLRLLPRVRFRREELELDACAEEILPRHGGVAGGVPVQDFGELVN